MYISLTITSRAGPMRQWKLHSKPWRQKSGCGIQNSYVEIQISEPPCWSRLCNCSPMHCHTTHYQPNVVKRCQKLLSKDSPFWSFWCAKFRLRRLILDDTIEKRQEVHVMIRANHCATVIESLKCQKNSFSTCFEIFGFKAHKHILQVNACNTTR